MITLPAILLALHTIFHVASAIGVFVGIIHSNEVHGRRWWKIIAAIFWALVSVLVLVGSLGEHHGC